MRFLAKKFDIEMKFQTLHRSLRNYLFCIILRVLGAMQLTERFARTSSLQTATEKRPKLARITLSASPGLGQERVSVEPSQAYDVDGGDTKSGRE